jgi:hypothetical protein
MRRRPKNRSLRMELLTFWMSLMMNMMMIHGT